MSGYDSELHRYLRIKLKYVNEMLGQCFGRSEAIAILMVEKQAIMQFLGNDVEPIFESPETTVRA